MPLKKREREREEAKGIGRFLSISLGRELLTKPSIKPTSKKSLIKVF